MIYMLKRKDISIIGATLFYALKIELLLQHLKFVKDVPVIKATLSIA